MPQIFILVIASIKRLDGFERQNLLKSFQILCITFGKHAMNIRAKTPPELASFRLTNPCKGCVLGDKLYKAFPGIRHVQIKPIGVFISMLITLERVVVNHSNRFVTTHFPKLTRGRFDRQVFAVHND